MPTSGKAWEQAVRERCAWKLGWDGHGMGARMVVGEERVHVGGPFDGNVVAETLWQLASAIQWRGLA